MTRIAPLHTGREGGVPDNRQQMIGGLWAAHASLSWVQSMCDQLDVRDLHDRLDALLEGLHALADAAEQGEPLPVFIVQDATQDATAEDAPPPRLFDKPIIGAPAGFQAVVEITAENADDFTQVIGAPLVGAIKEPKP